jgi:hypothetical protein
MQKCEGGREVVSDRAKKCAGFSYRAYEMRRMRNWVGVSWSHMLYRFRCEIHRGSPQLSILTAALDFHRSSSPSPQPAVSSHFLTGWNDYRYLPLYTLTSPSSNLLSTYTEHRAPLNFDTPTPARSTWQRRVLRWIRRT